MKWTVLVDNRTNDGTLQTEHGLAILLETEKHRVLLDTGASDMLIGNAECLGLDLGTVDYVFVSHGHSDHAGGLLFTGCAHSGLENILAACPYPVKTVVGGFHLLDGHETEEELLALAQRLSSHYPNTQFYTSHCTGDAAFDILKSVMGGKMNGFSCGGIRNEELGMRYV